MYFNSKLLNSVSEQHYFVKLTHNIIITVHHYSNTVQCMIRINILVGIMHKDQKIKIQFNKKMNRFMRIYPKFEIKMLHLIAKYSNRNKDGITFTTSYHSRERCVWIFCKIMACVKWTFRPSTYRLLKHDFIKTNLHTQKWILRILQTKYSFDGRKLYLLKRQSFTNGF